MDMKSEIVADAPWLLIITMSTGAWAGLHVNVPDRPSGKVAPVGCQLATTALQIQTVTIPQKVGCSRQKLSPSLGRQCIWAELHETGGLWATLAVDQLMRDVVEEPGPRPAPLGGLLLIKESRRLLEETLISSFVGGEKNLQSD